MLHSFTVYGNTESNFDLTLPGTSLPFRNYPRMGGLNNEIPVTPVTLYQLSLFLFQIRPH